MEVVVFEIKKENKKAVLTISSDDLCLVKEIYDDLTRLESKFQYGNLWRFTSDKKWHLKDCESD